jgi:phospholipase A-2-activating protein
MTAFRLREELLGHSQDVKALHADGPRLLSASRDATARAWTSSSDSKVYSSPQSGFINAVSSIELQGVQYLLTAGADTLVQAWPMDASEPTHALVGHALNVCCLAVSRSGSIISGSWDKTVKIWQDWNCVTTLEDHAQAVWDVLPIETAAEQGVVTACADNLVRFFPSFQQANVRYFKGHTQPVRALTLIRDDVFASGANDGSIRVWSLSAGSQLMQLDGHDSFVYSLDYIPETQEIVSGGEDRSMRIWSAQSGDLVQTITLPAISVWAVAALPHGDVAAGSSDGAVRTFSRDKSRQASETDLAVSCHRSPQTTVDLCRRNTSPRLPAPRSMRQSDLCFGC